MTKPEKELLLKWIPDLILLVLCVWGGTYNYFVWWNHAPLREGIFVLLFCLYGVWLAIENTVKISIEFKQERKKND